VILPVGGMVTIGKFTSILAWSLGSVARRTRSVASKRRRLGEDDSTTSV